MSHVNHLRFGIEVEFLLYLKDEKHVFKNIEGFAEFVLSVYQKEKDKSWPDMHIDLDGSFKGKNAATEWSFSKDKSIERDPNDKHTQYPIELVSPILHFTDGHFRDYVQGMWSLIGPLCVVKTNDSCGTHVHVSPSNEYTSAQIKAVARAALYFEPAINALVPPHRRNNFYSRNFFASNKYFKDKTPEQAIALVDGLDESHKAIIELMNPHDSVIPGPDRYYTWNFTNLKVGGFMTIEFRQGEGVITPAGALAWAEFVVTFVGAAVAVAKTYGDLKEFTLNVHGLKVFLGHGLVSGVSNRTLLEAITSRAKDSASVSGSDPGKLSKEKEDRLAKKRKEDDHKQIFAKKMIEDEKKRKKLVEEAGKLPKEEET
ncbi:hypothetical protein BDM02DRAFT_3191383 [Thelephora ganbajun]|uniref:Uncharacterized protein n=1 Tax=Thelephora ganbajun TaxID=370292 RepID=A0ACB6Z2X2_THEGA|nr:hypothetical protein BDM02DRAFT_3191383 [Thelephora ganbajun]